MNNTDSFSPPLVAHSFLRLRLFSIFLWFIFLWELFFLKSFFFSSLAFCLSDQFPNAWFPCRIFYWGFKWYHSRSLFRFLGSWFFPASLYCIALLPFGIYLRWSGQRWNFDCAFINFHIYCGVDPLYGFFEDIYSSWSPYLLIFIFPYFPKSHSWNKFSTFRFKVIFPFKNTMFLELNYSLIMFGSHSLGTSLFKLQIFPYAGQNLKVCLCKHRFQVNEDVHLDFLNFSIKFIRLFIPMFFNFSILFSFLIPFPC